MRFALAEQSIVHLTTLTLAPIPWRVCDNKGIYVVFVCLVLITKRLEDVEQKTQDQRLEDPELAASLCSAPGLALADADAASAHLPCHIIMYHSNISPVMSFPSAQKRNHQQLHASKL